jgi:hypothetical protein
MNYRVPTQREIFLAAVQSTTGFHPSADPLSFDAEMNLLFPRKPSFWDEFGCLVVFLSIYL